jgi:signal transduction histidine kinase
VDIGSLTTFLQSTAFRALRALTVVGIIGFFLWLRARQVSARLREQHEARLAERDRIARDLHDTLLQSTEGLILKVYAAAQQLPPDDPIRAFLMRSLDQAEELAMEGRQKLLGLRNTNTLYSRLELSQALAAVGLELSADTTMTFSAVKQGRVRALTASAWDETFGIAREAILNAFKHSHAHHVEAIVTYRSSSLTVQVRDDGSGALQLKKADPGADCHFGLRGMRERAEQLRATLDIKSAEDEGTTVSLIAPSRVVYRKRFDAGLEPSPSPLHSSFYRGAFKH